MYGTIIWNYKHILIAISTANLANKLKNRKAQTATAGTLSNLINRLCANFRLASCLLWCSAALPSKHSSQKRARRLDFLVGVSHQLNRFLFFPRVVHFLPLFETKFLKAKKYPQRIPRWTQRITVDGFT